MPSLPPPAIFDPLYYAAAALYLVYALLELTGGAIAPGRSRSACWPTSLA